MNRVLLLFLALVASCCSISAQDSTHVDSVSVRTDFILVQSAFPDSAEIDSLILAEYGWVAHPFLWV